MRRGGAVPNAQHARAGEARGGCGGGGAAPNAQHSRAGEARGGRGGSGCPNAQHARAAATGEADAAGRSVGDRSGDVAKNNSSITHNLQCMYIARAGGGAVSSYLSDRSLPTFSTLLVVLGVLLLPLCRRGAGVGGSSATAEARPPPALGTHTGPPSGEPTRRKPRSGAADLPAAPPPAPA